MVRLPEFSNTRGRAICLPAEDNVVKRKRMTCARHSRGDDVIDASEPGWLLHLIEDEAPESVIVRLSAEGKRRDRELISLLRVRCPSIQIIALNDGGYVDGRGCINPPVDPRLSAGDYAPRQGKSLADAVRLVDGALTEPEVLNQYA